MEKITSLPKKKFVIGTKQVEKKIKEGKVKNIIVAKNCPKKIIEKFGKSKVTIKVFSGDEKELGTKIGKPFPIAVVGYE